MKWYRRFPVLLFVVLVIPSIALYKWVDEKGTVHYSDKPPENNKQAPKIITPLSAPPESIDGAQRLKKQLEEQKKKEESRAVNEQKALKEQEDAQQRLSQRVKTCGRARQELSTLQKGRAFRYDENNTLAYLDDNTLNAEIKRLTAFIDAECNGSPEELKLQQKEALAFGFQQVIEDNCVVARDKFMLMDKPEARTPSSELKEAKQNFDRWCKNATGDKTIIMRREIIIIR
jgi:hypothetical protein